MSVSQNQVARMLALVPYLRSRGGIPVEDVARDFSVPVRKIIQDLNILWFCGLPNALPGDMISVDMDALKNDGVVILEDADFLSKPARITAFEALALIVALRSIRASASGDLAGVIDSAAAKLESISGDMVEPPVDVVVETVNPQTQATLENAIATKMRVAIDYTTPARDEQNHREIDPLRMFTAQGRVFCQAWCCLAEDTRLFRLDRILEATLTSTPAQPHDPKERRLPEDLFEVSDQTPWAILDLAPPAHWLADYYTAETVREPADGIWRVKLFATGMPWLRRLVLKNAGPVTVIEPQSLADAVVEHAQLALGAYDGT